MLLYRPVGLEELVLVFDAGMKAFPPRLPDLLLPALGATS